MKTTVTAHNIYVMNRRINDRKNVLVEEEMVERRVLWDIK